jgi:hypothetical protein
MINGPLEEKIKEMTENNKLRWRTTIETLHEMGTLKPYHQELVEARAKLGEFDLVWTVGGDLEVLYLDMPISVLSVDGGLRQSIEDNGKRTVELLEEEFVTLLSEV